VNSIEKLLITHSAAEQALLPLSLFLSLALALAQKQ